ncbi:MAG: RHS repeat-associated core domain-containing protein [Chitinophagaceae bacterium]|nr:RHS repeat-associated core domain-containing protein [Chitinophagaceae bacterium]
MKNVPCFVRLCSLAIALLVIAIAGKSQSLNPGHAIGPVNGVYHYNYNQTPAQLVEIRPVAISGTGYSYQWYSSFAPEGTFNPVSTATAASYSPGILTQTTYYRRRTQVTVLGISLYIWSNVVKLSVVSANWEDRNYVREHEVLKKGVTTWQAVDQLAIGDKLQTTTYLDGLGRSVQKISRETATPADGVTLWGDMVQFSAYDAMGREPVKYLPFTTSTASGKFKTVTTTEQAGYYTGRYNETNAYTTTTYDNSPLNRVTKVRESGTAWAATGNTVQYEMNEAAEDVKIWDVNYVQGNPPVYRGAYGGYTLFKNLYKDVNAKTVIEYSNKSGQLVLKKVQVDDAPTAHHTGWACTYYIYDDFGLLRYQLQPEAVKYLAANSWSFAGTNGTTVLNELCFLYNYDDKGRMTWKKAPGAQPLKMLYDKRDRVVFMQDGNQAARPTPQWTATLYDELDRPVMSVLYNTTKTAATLQTNINNAAALTTITITNTANTGGGNIVVVTSLNPVSATDLNNATTTNVVKHIFYDNYGFAGVKTFNTGYTNLSAYSASTPNVMPIATSKRVTNRATGARTRVLGTGTFLSSTTYYDEKGRAIQTLEDNMKTGTDITTLQYHFDGRVLSSCTDHTTTGAGYTNFKILTKNIFDKLGRVTSIQKQYGSNAFKTIAAYKYDDMGRLKNKILSPGYTNPLTGLAGMESLDYSFNIHNQITGINKEYALKTGAYNKWSHYFGMYLGFDNRDNVFTKAELNGQVTGIVWNSQGDDAQRRYNYVYDNAGRLTNANFTERASVAAGWANTKMDFTVSGAAGKITYDLNGNLLTMLQKGVMPGTANPITIDDLRYTYSLYSNKLQKVADQMTATAQNGKFGDFKDGANGTNPDYVYDQNGNIVTDLNKNLQSANGGSAGSNGVIYNYLDKPEIIRIVGKGTIKMVYSANGEKLQRVFIPEAGGVSTITTYINAFIYQESSTTLIASSLPPFAGTGLALTSIYFEEGRIRVITPVNTGNGNDLLTISGNIALPNSRQGAFDYYVRDYQENVRMILTEETHTAYNTATMETARASAEIPVFGQPGAANEVTSTRFAKPAGWTNNTSAQVSRLGNLAGKNIGPNTLQKVMAGDRISAQVSYYFTGAPGNNNANMVTNVLSSLISSLSNGGAAGGLVKGGATGINSQLAASAPFATAVAPTGSGSTTPQAYLTMLFFDERFTFISAADGGVVQAQVASTWSTSTAPLVLANIRTPKNGYVYVYISNRSDQHVYFDDFKVAVTAGNIIEENHYYAFGMRIAAISSKKLGNVNEGVLKNDYLYNDKELFDDGDLNWYDYGFRNYDAQIGKFIQMDPLADGNSGFSPYSYAANDPIGNIDFLGLDAITSTLSTTAETAITLGTVTITAVKATSAGLSTVSLASKVISITSITLRTVNTACNIINSNITTSGVGGGDPVKLALISAQGMGDAGTNAMLLGIPNMFGSYNHENDYTDIEEKRAYLEGRLMGDAAVLGTTVPRMLSALGTAAAGSETVVVGIAGLLAAAHAGASGQAAVQDVITVVQKLYQLNMSSTAGSDATNNEIKQEKSNEHHSYPKALGGHPDQKTSSILESLHTGVGGIHSDLAKFEGGWLRPKPGMTGKQIVEKYGADKVIEGLRRFYNQPKWKHLLKDFEDAVKYTQSNK